jgi:hypothetical protein
MLSADIKLGTPMQRIGPTEEEKSSGGTTRWHCLRRLDRLVACVLAHAVSVEFDVAVVQAVHYPWFGHPLAFVFLLPPAGKNVIGVQMVTQ